MKPYCYLIITTVNKNRYLQYEEWAPIRAHSSAFFSHANAVKSAGTTVHGLSGKK